MTTETEKKALNRVIYWQRMLRSTERVLEGAEDSPYAPKWRDDIARYKAKLALAKKQLKSKRLSGAEWERLNGNIEMVAARKALHSVRESLSDALRKLRDGEITPKEANAIAKAANKKLKAL